MNADRISVNECVNMGDEGGEGKIVGRVNVHGAWDRAGRASRTDPEGIPKKWWTGNNTKETRSLHDAMKAKSAQKIRRADMRNSMNTFR